MEDDTWSFGLSTASRTYQSTLKSPSDLCIDFEDIEDDDIKAEYPCPFCSEDFDLLGLCCHIDEEHPVEAESGVCPVCAARVGMNMIGHVTAQHGNIFKSHHKLKLHKGGSHSSLSFSKKELQDGHLQSLLVGSSSMVSSSKMALDPLLSFIYNVPVAGESVHPDSSTEVSSDEKTLEGNVHLSPLSNKDHEEKTKRCEFVEGLLLSTIFDDIL